MRSNLHALAVLLPMLAAAFDAGAAACTAANPNASLIEHTPTSAFTDNGNGTVTHNLTGLMWKQCTQGLSGAGCATGSATQMTWSNALKASVTDTTGGYNDWRPPNLKELESIVEFCGHGPAINRTLFPATPASTFLSGSTYPSNYLAYAVNFNDGGSSGFQKTSSGYLRLVRGGSSFAGYDANRLGMIDVDGDGKADALTDGLLLIRYLFGLRGASLINGAIGVGATRTTATEIEIFIQTLLP
ncbi:MAG: DUF1566 domain-containing protein [Betaproteobacteria bacterium]